MPESIDVSHLDLLERSRELRRSALAGDVDAVHRHLLAIRNEVSRHVRGERDQFAGLSAAAQGIVAQGQRDLQALVEEILADDSDSPGCNCIRRSADLTRAIVRQARLEADVSSIQAGG